MLTCWCQKFWPNSTSTSCDNCVYQTESHKRSKLLDGELPENWHLYLQFEKQETRLNFNLWMSSTSKYWVLQENIGLFCFVTLDFLPTFFLLFCTLFCSSGAVKRWRIVPSSITNTDRFDEFEVLQSQLLHTLFNLCVATSYLSHVQLELLAIAHCYNLKFIYIFQNSWHNRDALLNFWAESKAKHRSGFFTLVHTFLTFVMASQAAEFLLWVLAYTSFEWLACKSSTVCQWANAS